MYDFSSENVWSLDTKDCFEHNDQGWTQGNDWFEHYEQGSRQGQILKYYLFNNGNENRGNIFREISEKKKPGEYGDENVDPLRPYQP